MLSVSPNSHAKLLVRLSQLKPVAAETENADHATFDLLPPASSFFPSTESMNVLVGLLSWDDIWLISYLPTTSLCAISRSPVRQALSSKPTVATNCQPSGS